MRPVAINARRGRRESPHYKAQDWSELLGRVQLETALSNDRCESATRFEKPAMQALALATEP